MICIDVKRNGDRVSCAGISDALTISTSIHSWVGGDAPAQLDIRGMCELPGSRDAHVYWTEFVELGAGDIIQFAFGNTESPSPPLEIKPTDSPEYLQEQREFEEMDRNFVPPTERTIIRNPNVSFKMRLNGSAVGHAVVNDGEEHILCTLTWVKCRPERCRVFVRSFGGMSKASGGRETNWYRAHLAVDDIMEVVIGA